MMGSSGFQTGDDAKAICLITPTRFSWEHTLWASSTLGPHSGGISKESGTTWGTCSVSEDVCGSSPQSGWTSSIGPNATNCSTSSSPSTGVGSSGSSGGTSDTFSRSTTACTSAPSSASSTPFPPKRGPLVASRIKKDRHVIYA